MTVKDSISLHQRILTDIADRILSGEWPPGYRIPFEHELMAQYKCSRMTVSKVLTHLANADMIERRRKAGSFVSKPHLQSAVLEIPDIKAEVSALGLPYSFDLLIRRRRKSSQGDRTALDLKTPGPVLELTCCHYAGRQPFCFEERLINVAAVPEAAEVDFAAQAPGAWLMSHIPWTAAEHRIQATEASALAAEALKLAAGKPCLVIERRTWSADHTVTFVRLTYPGHLHELIARFAPADKRTAGTGSKAGNVSPFKPRQIGTAAPAPGPEPEAPVRRTGRPAAAQRR
ncbi:MAG: histidine utilization repressor [Rhodospirillaceae bacterium]|nr:histidine utilization repressor [Rhodospirillaceae bacterium]